jgi:3-mercaptopyruvate sulfurtransferase SseA
VDRRQFFLASSSIALLPAAERIANAYTDPWKNEQLLQPEQLASALNKRTQPLVIVAVVFPVLYRQKHIPGALLAGPTGKPEGIEGLKKAVTSMTHDANIILYCGCCPMDVCPNIRPAFLTLKDMGFSNVRVLSLPTSFRADWVDKGYPVTSEMG